MFTVIAKGGVESA